MTATTARRPPGPAVGPAQLFFDDSLSKQILASQPIYRSRGPKDTSSLADPVVVGSALRDCFFQTEQLADGSIMAWKSLIAQG